MACDTCIGMPSDRVRKKISYAEMFGENCVNYTDNTLCNAEITTDNKIDNKGFRI